MNSFFKIMETIDLTATLETTTFQCDFCDFKTISAIYLKTHRRVKHINVGQLRLGARKLLDRCDVPWKH